MTAECAALGEQVAGGRWCLISALNGQFNSTGLEKGIGDNNRKLDAERGMVLQSSAFWEQDFGSFKEVI